MRLLVELLLIITTVLSYPNIKPDLNGKFFYADLREGLVYGMSLVDVLIGSENKHFQLAFTSSESTLGVISSECDNFVCYVQDKYDPSESKTSKEMG